MGQPITVIEKPSSNPALMRFETNRPLSGMGHEHYTEPPGELLVRPVDELARRLFTVGGIDAIHINGSVVTVSLGAGRTGAGLGDVIRNLFLHYGDQSAAATAGAPADDADAAPETLADTADAPAAESAAGEAPAPVEGGEAPPAEQEVEGVPAADAPEPNPTVGDTPPAD